MIRRILLICFLFLNLEVFGQLQPDGQSTDNNNMYRVNYALSSPTASGMTKVADVPVNLATGTPEISIPLYEINTGKLSVPISLVYDASGIKVEQQAGQVGLGWSLIAGGAINKRTRDKDDLAINTSRYETNNGPLWNIAATPNPDTDPDDFHLAFDITHGVVDGVPDLYSINASGVSGNFIFLTGNQNSTYALGARFYPRNNVEVTDLNGGFGNPRDGFIVKNGSGDKYTFGGSDLNGTTAYEENASQTLNSPTGLISSNLGSTEFRTTWYLNQLVSADGSDVIQFDYQTGAYYEFVQGHFESRTYIQSEFENFVYNPVYAANVSTLQKIQGRKLKEIFFNNGSVQFTYSTISRDDYGSTSSIPTLETITVKDLDQNVIKKVKFFYSYFTDGGSNPEDKRLKLEKIQVLDGVSPDQEYTFTYNSTLLPSKTSFAQDHWGYYNGKNNASLLPQSAYTYNFNYSSDINYYLNCAHPFLSFPTADRESDFNYAKAGMLEKIKYPTGGEIQFEYEQNDIPRAATDKSYTAKHLAPWLTKISDLYMSNPDGIQMSIPNPNNVTTTTAYYTYEFDVPTDILMIPAVVNGVSTMIPAPMYGKINAMFSHPPSATSYEVDHSNSSVTVNQFFNGQNTYLGGHTFLYNASTNTQDFCQTSMLLQPGSHISVTVATQGIGYSLSAVFDCLIPREAGYGELNKPIGGLRIRSITSSSGFGPTIKKKYTYRDISNPNLSSGYSRNPVTPLSYIKSSRDYTPQCTTTEIDPVDGSTHVVNVACCYPIRELVTVSSDPADESEMGSSIYYRYVTVENGVNNEGGKEVYAFYPEASSQFTWRNNLLTNKKVFDQNGTLKAESIYDYNLSLGSTETLIGWKFIEEGKHPCASWPGGTGYNRKYQIIPYTLRSEFNALVDQTDKEYFGGTTLTHATNYDYDLVNLQPSKITSARSDGRQEIQYVKYATHPDYAVPATVSNSQLNTEVLALRFLNQSHRISTPIEKYQTIKEVNGTENVIGAQIADYFPYSSVATSSLMHKVYSFNIPQPILLSSFQQSVVQPNGSSVYSLVRDNNYTLETSLSYDTRFNTNEELNEHGISNSLIWMYKQQYPVAKAVNSCQGGIAFTSFETDEHGNWDYNEDNVVASHITGKKGYQLDASSPISKYTFSCSGNYFIPPGICLTISYWKKVGSGTVTVNGQPPTMTGNTIGNPSDGDWVYCEHNNIIGTNVVVSGTAIIDELRAYPCAAQMETYTYNPLVGITSKCSVSNLISFYEYDALGRLKLIRDQYGKIVQKIDYGIQKPE